MTSQNIVGQVLGSSTAIAAGVAILPNTGNNQIAFWLAATSIAAGLAVLSSFIISRVIRKMVQR